MLKSVFIEDPPSKTRTLKLFESQRSFNVVSKIYFSKKSLDIDQSEALKGSASQVVCARRDKKVAVGSTEDRRRWPEGTRAVSAAMGRLAWKCGN